MDSHYWSTNYGPVAGVAPYQIPPKISAVIGGKASGGASVMTPAGRGRLFAETPRSTFDGLSGC